MAPHGDKDLGPNIGSDIAWLPDCSKPLPEPILTYH